jgi:hypothetical protein
LNSVILFEGHRDQVPNNEQKRVIAAFGDQMGDSLSPLKAFRVKRGFPQGSQTAEFVDLIIAVFVSL